MLALNSLPIDDLRGVNGIIFDVDDTLTTDGLVSPEAFEALWSIRRAGLRAIAISGRPLGWTDGWASIWPVDMTLGENGAGFAYRTADGVEHGYFCDEEERSRQRTMLDTIQLLVSERMPRVSLASDQGSRRCDLAFDVAERQRLPQHEVSDLVRLIESQGARSYVSSVHAHAVTGDWDKAKGLALAFGRAWNEDLSAERHRWLFVGDSGNDAPAFRFFPLSIGVANLLEHVEKIDSLPTYITTESHGAGFAEVCHLLLSKRQSS